MLIKRSVSYFIVTIIADDYTSRRHLAIKKLFFPEIKSRFQSRTRGHPACPRARRAVDHYVIAFQLLMAVILLLGHTRAIMHVYTCVHVRIY